MSIIDRGGNGKLLERSSDRSGGDEMGEEGTFSKGLS
jgi:hypothetical protein